MPPLEALACGVPVITADNSSLPEVVGDTGTLVKCTDTEQITSRMKEHLDGIKDITEAIKVRGPSQAQKFSWEKSARVYWDHLIKELN
jgi:glycosyltransferase involved in cell wall biosynthesis